MKILELRTLLNEILRLEREIRVLLNKEPFDVKDEINTAHQRHGLEWEQLQLIWKLEGLSEGEDNNE